MGTLAVTSETKQGLLGLAGIIAVLLTILAIIYWGIPALLAQLEGNISRAMVLGFFTVVGSVAGVLITQWQIKKREIAEAHRAKRKEIYQDFMDDCIIRTLRKVNNQSAEAVEDDKQLQDAMMKFTGQIVVWGDPEVIKVFWLWRQAAQQESQEESDILMKTDNFLRAMRADLDNSNSGLQRGDLIKLFLRDPERLNAAISGDAD